jgi:hypothetical protein
MPQRMKEQDEFIVESDAPDRTAGGELTGWEVIVFELADDEDDGE